MSEYERASGKSLEFMYAAGAGNINGLQTLWDHHEDEINLDARDGDYEWSILHCAIRYAPEDKVNDIVDFLLEIGCDPAAKTGNGQNASNLILAASKGYEHVIQSLIAKLQEKFRDDPDQYIRELEHKSAYTQKAAQETAELHGHPECAAIIGQAIKDGLPPPTVAIAKDPNSTLNTLHFKVVANMPTCEQAGEIRNNQQPKTLTEIDLSELSR